MSPIRSSRQDLARNVALGLGAALAFPAAAHADADSPDPQGPDPQLLRHLDPADAAQIREHAQQTAPAPRQPTAPATQRIGRGDFETPAPKPAAPAPQPKAATPPPQPKPEPAHVQRIGRGDYETPDQTIARTTRQPKATPAPPKQRAKPDPPQPKPDPPKAKPAPPAAPKPIPANVQRIGRGDYDPNIVRSPAEPAGKPAQPKPAQPQPAQPTATPDPPAASTAPPATPTPIPANTQRIGRGDFDPRIVRAPAPKPAKPPKARPAAKTAPTAVPPPTQATPPPPAQQQTQRIGRGDFDPRATVNNPPPPTPYDSRDLLPKPPRIQRFGLGDMRPDPPPNVVQIGSAPDLTAPGGANLIPYPGAAGDRTTVTLKCGRTAQGPTRGSTSCTGVPKGAYTGKHRASPKYGVTVETSASGTAARGPDRVTPDGPRSSLQISLETVSKVGGEAKLKKLKVSYKKITKGHRTLYQLTSTPERISQIAKDPSLAPRANDPTTLKAGDGIVLNQDQFTGDEGGASVNDTVSVDEQRTHGTRQSAGVQRLANGKIRITVGDDQFVRDVVKSGLGNDVASVGINNTMEDTKGQGRQVELDITKEDDWNIYQRFMATGRIAWNKDLKFGVIDRTTSTGSHGYSIKVGPLEHTSTLSSGDEEVRTTRNSDGTTDESFTRRYNGVTVAREQVAARDGRKGTAVNTLMLKGAPAAQLARYQERGGTKVGRIDQNGTADVRIEFTDDDLERIRQNEITWYQQHVNRDQNSDGSTLSRDEAVDYARTDYATAPVGQQGRLDIVRARTPREILMALYASSDGHPGRIIDSLNYNADTQGGGRPPGRTVKLSK